MNSGIVHRGEGQMTPIINEIRQAIEKAGDQPVRLEDPQTQKTYILVRADLYDHM
jgi:hypothetical protein